MPSIFLSFIFLVLLLKFDNGFGDELFSTRMKYFSKFPTRNRTYEDFEFIDNGVIKVGVLKDAGGMIGFLSQTGGTLEDSVINIYNKGRAIQISYYADPLVYDPDRKSCGKNTAWAKDWPWNPIGSVDIDGNEAEIVSLTVNPELHQMNIVTRPLQWACHNVPCECLFKQIITLDGNRVYLKATLENSRTDIVDYVDQMEQEQPAVYTVGRLSKLYSYSGTKPFTNDDVVELNTEPHVPWHPGKFQAQEYWAAFVDTNEWGLGVYQQGHRAFIGGFSGTPGTGGPQDDDTGYITPVRSLILSGRMQYSYKVTFILDYLPNIRKYVYSQQPSQPSH